MFKGKNWIDLNPVPEMKEVRDNWIRTFRTGVMVILAVEGMSIGWLNAQGGWIYGFRGGYGPALLFNPQWMDDGNYGYRYSDSWSAGGMVGYNAVYYNVGYALEVYYRQISMRSLYSVLDSAGMLIRDVKEDIRLSYLEIPLLLRFRSRGDPVTKMITYGGPYLEVGIALLYLLQAKYSLEGASQNLDVRGLAPFSFAGILGFGFHQIGTERLSVTHGVRITFAIQDIVQDRTDPNGLFIAPRYYGNPWRAYAWTRYAVVQYFFSFLIKSPHAEYRSAW